MTDTRESLVIDVTLGDQVTKVIPGIKAAIEGMAKEASEALGQPGEALKVSLGEAAKSLGGNQGIQDLRQRFEAARTSIEQLRVSVADLRATQEAAAREGAVAVDVYIDALKRQSAALTLTNQERQEAAALLTAERIAAEAGGTPSQAQRDAIIEEMRAREQLAGVRAQEAAELARSQELNRSAVQAEVAGRAEVMRSLRDSIVTREREAESIRKSFDAAQLARAQDLNRGTVTQGTQSRAREIAELREAIQARAAEAEVLRRNRVTLDQYMAGLRDERVLLQLDVRQREVVIAQRRAEDLAIKAGITDRTRLLQLVRQEVQENQKARAAALGGVGGQGTGFSSLLGAAPLGGTAGQLQGFALQARAGAAALGEVGVAAGASTAALGPLAIAVGAVLVGFKAMAEGAALVKQAVDDSIALSNALKPIALQSAAGAKGLAALKDEIQAISRETGRAPTEIAAAARFVAPIAGFQQQANTLREYTRLAQATLTDVSTAAQALDAVLDAYGDSVDKARARGAQLFVGARAGEVDVLSYGRALADVGPIAEQFGVSFEDVAQVISVMSARTGDAGKGAVALKRLLGDLRDPASELSVEMRRAGVDTQSLAFRQQQLGEIIEDVARVVRSEEGLDQKLFGDGRTAASLFAAIQGVGSESVRILRDQDGSIAQMTTRLREAETATESWGRVFEKLKEQSGLNDIGAGIEKALGDLGNFIDSRLGSGASTAIAGGAVDLALSPFGAIGTALSLARRYGAQASEEARKAGADSAKAAVDAARTVIEQSVPAELPFRLRIDPNANLQRSIDEAIVKLSPPFVDINLRGEFPKEVNDALRVLFETPRNRGQELLPDQKEQLDAAVQTLQRYGTAAAQASNIVGELNRRTLTGSARVRAEQEETVRGYQRQIATIRDVLPVAAEAADAALKAFGDQQSRDAQIEANRVLSVELSDQLAAQIELKRASEERARAVGNVALAERIGLSLARDQETLELRRLALAEQQALKAREGDIVAQEAVRARFEALRRELGIQRQTTEEIRRRTQIERTAESQRTILGIRASLGVGLSGEIERIRQAGEAERAAARSALEALKASAGATAEDIRDKVAETAALVESSNARQRRAEAEITGTASAEIASTILGLQEQTARTYEEQRAVLLEIARAEETRLVAALTADGATEAQIQRLRELLGLKREQSELELKISDAQRSAVEEARRSLGGRTEGQDAFAAGFEASIKDLRRLFADDFTRGVELARDALQTFRDSGVRNMEDVLDGTQSLSDGLEGIASDFLRSIRRNLLDGLFSQLSGGLGGLFGGLFGGGGAGLTGVLGRAQGGVEHGRLTPVYQAAEGFLASSRTRLDVAEVPGLQELIAPLVRGKLPVHVDERGGMQVRVRGAQVPVALEGSGTRRRADAAIFAGGARERSSTDTRAAARTERVGGSQVTIAPGAFVMQGHSFTINVQAKGGAQAAQDIGAQMPMITKAIAADIQRGTTRALRDAIREASR